MEKFSFLNLNCDVGRDKNSSDKTPHKHGLDARNVFKSTVIKFALLQKALKGCVFFIPVSSYFLKFYVLLYHVAHCGPRANFFEVEQPKEPVSEISN
jgi:hypothetical protein